MGPTEMRGELHGRCRSALVARARRGLGMADGCAAGADGEVSGVERRGMRTRHEGPAVRRGALEKVGDCTLDFIVPVVHVADDGALLRGA